MRLAIISDIHGNLIALETVLAAIAAEGIDDIVCLGDTSTDGPQPQAVLARLRARQLPIVIGNTDEWLLQPKPFEVRDENSHRFTDMGYWCLEQLSAADLDYIRTFQKTIEVSLGTDQSLLCFHGSPQANTDIIVAATPEDELDTLLSGYDHLIMAGGHTHTPMLRRTKQTLLINPGSVGLPFEIIRGSGQARNPPWAEYAILTAEVGDLRIELRRTPVDVAAVKQAIRDSGMPHADWLCQDWG